MPGHYGIPGKKTAQEIKDTVAWLCSKSNFMCGDLKPEVHNHSFPIDVALNRIQSQSCDRNKIYRHPCIAKIVRAQWFSKGQADCQTHTHMLETKMVPAGVIVLVVATVNRGFSSPWTMRVSTNVSQIEQCLQEWANGFHSGTVVKEVQAASL